MSGFELLVIIGFVAWFAKEHAEGKAADAKRKEEFERELRASRRDPYYREQQRALAKSQAVADAELEENNARVRSEWAALK